MRPLHPSTHLLLALAAAVALLPCAVAQQSDRLPDTPTVAEQYLLSAANQERAARNLPLLHRDPQLARAAAQHAQAMAEHGSISHQFAGEPALARRAAGMGVAFSLISENVAEAPSAVQIHEMWMHSEGHRANLLDPAIDAAGIRVIARNGELYAVEDFARTVPSASLDEQEFAIRALIAQLGQIALATTPDATLRRAPDLRHDHRLREREQALVRHALHLRQPHPTARRAEDAARLGPLPPGRRRRLRRQLHRPLHVVQHRRPAVSRERRHRTTSRLGQLLRRRGWVGSICSRSLKRLK